MRVFFLCNGELKRHLPVNSFFEPLRSRAKQLSRDYLSLVWGFQGKFNYAAFSSEVSSSLLYPFSGGLC